MTFEDNSCQKTKMELYDISSRERVGNAAVDEMNTLSSKSKLERDESQIHDLSWEDIEEHSTVGVGGYSRVYKVMVNQPQLEYTSFALKCLDKKTMKADQAYFRTGAIDLAVEGEILSRLRHENIIQLHGVTAGGPLKAYTQSERGYFLVLDLLEDTLTNKLEKQRHKRGLGGRRSKGTSASSVVERLQGVALGVAKGLEYLHQNNVVLRDLKPDNVGFDRNGTPKLFDLGFAREVHTVDNNEIAGSLRYMAPEVALGCGTLLASDVYSFGVLLWELCTLEKPYKRFASREEFMHNVIVRNYRPSCSSIRSAALSRLIKECWDPNPENRPSMSKVVKILRIETTLSMGGLSKKKSTDPLQWNTPFGSLKKQSSLGSLTASTSSRRTMSGSWSTKNLSSSSLNFFRSVSKKSLISSSNSSALCKNTGAEEGMISNKVFDLTTNLNTRNTMFSLHESCPEIDFSLDEDDIQ
jgi:serine/threonine protein kinase